ncbi:hypothetical protein M422DRAFT_50638 [Sphaerobolus stellatus SS14]|uniref:Uncharacterized protein n=1 Tax=Sphaerobolus stellatus (strain SS14) TaxID=990650 RepID=A0A0C9V6I8_SPHS4|nr:hypothetical protein M422DRAFT_50638 [Sphaerobolus stellatus SS14]
MATCVSSHEEWGSMHHSLCTESRIIQKALPLLKICSEFKVTNVPIPNPSKNQILVKVRECPAILCLDSTDVTGEVSKGVTTFQKGDRVFHEGNLNIRSGAYQQYAVAPAWRTIRCHPQYKAIEFIMAVLGTWGRVESHLRIEG